MGNSEWEWEMKFSEKVDLLQKGEKIRIQNEANKRFYPKIIFLNF